MILRPRGNLVGSEESDELDRSFDELRQDGVRNVVLNLAAVGLVNSLAMSRLVRSHLKLHAARRTDRAVQRWTGASTTCL